MQTWTFATPPPPPSSAAAVDASIQVYRYLYPESAAAEAGRPPARPSWLVSLAS